MKPGAQLYWTKKAEASTHNPAGTKNVNVLPTYLVYT
jgi:hypothetical protein